MKITLIGGSGFIGSSLIGALEMDNLINNLDKVDSSLYYNITKKVDIRDYADILENLSISDWVVLLAAEHRDDVSPTSLYYDVNVEGTKKVLSAMDVKGVNKIIFTSSVAVYGLNKNNPDVDHPADPFNDYGKSKWLAEETLREWYQTDSDNRTLIIIRPTVVFGPGNRGNVYNLLNQIARNRFFMIGKGENEKSMAYVENIVSFIRYCIQTNLKGYHVFNYVDKPDLTTCELVKVAGETVGKKSSKLRIPYWLGYLGGVGFDILAKLTHKKYPISSIRVKKFCATTQFSARSVEVETDFKPPFTLQEGLVKTIQSIASGNDQPISSGNQ